MKAPHSAPLECNLEVGVIEHDHRVLAAQLQHDRKQPTRSGFRHPLAGGDASGEDQLVDRGFRERRARRPFADDHLHQIGVNPASQQQPLQLQRDQRCELRRLQHNRVAGHQRAQGLDRRHGERIIPRRDDADHAVRLPHQLAALGLHGQVAVRQRLLAQKAVRIANAELRRIEHDQHFGRQRLGGGLAGLAANQLPQLRRAARSEAAEIGAERRCARGPESPATS